MCKKLGVVVENFAQEGWKFFSLHRIGRYDFGGVADTLATRQTRQRALAKSVERLL